MLRAEMRHADKINFAICDKALLIQQPRAASRSEAFDNVIEWCLAAIIMIARHAVHRHFNAGKNFKRFRQKFSVLDDITGETNKIRRKRIDGIDDRLRVRAVAFVVQVGELDKAMSRLVRETEARGFDPLRL